MMKTLITTLALAIAVTGPALAFDAEKGMAHEPRAGHSGFMAADSDNDGRISKHEFLNLHAKKGENMFQRMDNDHDGQLSRDELQSARQSMKQKMQERMRTWQSQ